MSDSANSGESTSRSANSRGGISQFASSLLGGGLSFLGGILGGNEESAFGPDFATGRRRSRADARTAAGLTGALSPFAFLTQDTPGIVRNVPFDLLPPFAQQAALDLTRRQFGGLLENRFPDLFGGQGEGRQRSKGLSDQELIDLISQPGGFRGQALGALDDFDSDIADLIASTQQRQQAIQTGLSDAADDFLARSAAERESLLGGFDERNQQVQGLVNQAVTGAEDFGDRSIEALQARFDETVRNQSARLGNQLSGRGLGSSTLLESGIANSIIPNALSSRLAGEASIANQANQLATQAATSGAGILSSTLAQRAGLAERSLENELARALGLLQQEQVALPEAFLSRELGLAQTPINFRAQTLGQPSAIFPQSTPIQNPLANAPGNFGPSSLQNVGGILQAIGGQGFGAGGGLGGLLGGLGQLFQPSEAQQTAQRQQADINRTVLQNALSQAPGFF